MVYIFTLSDKSLIGKKNYESATFLAENCFKKNMRIGGIYVLSPNEKIITADKFKEDDVVFFLVEKANLSLNEYLCNICSCKLNENSFLKETVLNFYKKMNSVPEKFAENEWKIPDKARAVVNPNGLTQGYILSDNRINYIILPAEFMQTEIIYDTSISDYLNNLLPNNYKNLTLKTFGLNEENVILVISDLLKNKDGVSINLFSKGLKVDIVLKSKKENVKLDDYAKIIYNKLNHYIYSMEDISAENLVNTLLKNNNYKLSVVETVTAGNLTKNILYNNTEINELVEESMVLNSNNSIINFLGSNEILLKHGRCSGELAYELAVKMLNITGSDIVIASTGQFKPSENSPAGTTYIAIGDKSEIHVYKNIFCGTNQEIIDSITNANFFYLIKKLRKNDIHFQKYNV